MKFWLIQRGTFKNNIKNCENISSIIDLDYMGSAEFEFGALPRSLKRIVGNMNDMIFCASGNPDCYYFCKNDKEVIAAIDKFLKKQYLDIDPVHLKERMQFPVKVSRPANNFKTNFWWDIENDFFVCLYGQHVLAIEKALKNLLKQSYHKT